MIWHVIYEVQDGRVQSRAARSRDLAIHVACELFKQSCEVRRVIEPNGSMIEGAELEAVAPKVVCPDPGEPLARAQLSISAVLTLRGILRPHRCCRGPTRNPCLGLRADTPTRRGRLRMLSSYCSSGSPMPLSISDELGSASARGSRKRVGAQQPVLSHPDRCTDVAQGVFDHDAVAVAVQNQADARPVPRAAVPPHRARRGRNSSCRRARAGTRRSLGRRRSGTAAGDDKTRDQHTSPAHRSPGDAGCGSDALWSGSSAPRARRRIQPACPFDRSSRGSSLGGIPAPNGVDGRI